LTRDEIAKRAEAVFGEMAKKAGQGK